MNILISSYCVDKNDISEAQISYEWIKRLSEYAKLWVLTIGSRKTAICGLEDLPNVNLVIIKQTMRFKRFDVFDRAVHPGYVEFFIKARRQARKILSTEKIDLCHHLSPQSPRFPSIFLGLKYPYIIGPIHGGLESPTLMKELAHREPFLFKLRKLDAIRAQFDLLLRRTYLYSSATLITAPYVGNISPVNLSHNLKLLSGVAISLPDEPVSKDNNFHGKIKVIYAGRLVPSKGIELMIDAISQIKDERFLFLICGTGDDLFYREYARKRNIKNIEWLGHISQDQLSQLYKTSDIFVFPSLKEPAGTVVLEAMSFGLPVICMNVGGPSYFVDEHCGFKIELGNKEQVIYDLKNTILKLGYDSELRKKMSISARKKVSEFFTWERLIPRMLTIYAEVLNGKKS